MSALFRAPTLIVTNKGFDDETGLLGYAFADERREVLATATDAKRRSRPLMRLAPPIEPKPFRFDLTVRASDGAPLLRIEKRQRFPQRVWTRVSGPDGEVLGFASEAVVPFSSRDFSLKEAGGKAVASIENAQGRGWSRPGRGPLTYVCVQNGTEIARVVATRNWQTKVRGTRDFFNRFGNEYTLALSDDVTGALRMLVVAFPVIADISRDFMAHQHAYTR